MALAHAILACLTEQPRSGYDLAKYFDASIGFFWRASHPQIYRELRKLQEAGRVHGEEAESVRGRPRRIVYSITDAGRAALLDWSREWVEPPTMKDDLLVRLYALDEVDPEALRAHVERRLVQHRARAARYEQIRDRFYGGEVEGAAVGRLLGLELGLRYERQWVDWCEEALRRLPG